MSNLPLPLNLPHAATVANRIVYHIDRRLQIVAPPPRGERDDMINTAYALSDLLRPYRHDEDNPPEDEAKRVTEEAARLCRRVVDLIEKTNVGDDRLGQAVRNLFENLQKPDEGLDLSLRAGENPDSALRP